MNSKSLIACAILSNLFAIPLNAATNIVGDEMDNPIVIGTYSAAFSYTNSADTRDFTDEYSGLRTKDVFHKLVLTKAMDVTFSHSGSSLLVTQLYLLDASGTLLRGELMLRGNFIETLNAGTYFLVSEGGISNGVIRLTVTGVLASEFGYPTFPSSDDTQSGEVGSMDGTFSVSPTGGATYSIPIKVPGGVGGFQPHLAIIYNSQAGNGVAGYGTSISGLSSITRGVKDIFHDGTANGIAFGADDALYLNGVRLILVSGTAGQNGAVYNPESDPYTQVTVHGNCSSTTNNIWYEVLSSDGTTYRFGYDDNSCLSYSKGTSDRIYSWYVCHAEQPTGNHMTYTYQKENNCIYLNRIEYGDRTGTMPHRVEFAYESRNDSIPVRFDGIQGSMNKRLHTVTAKTNGAVYRSYTLNYNSTGDGSATKFSRLVSVSEKNGNNDILPATTLNWSYLPTVAYSSSALNISTSGTGTNAIPFDEQSFDVSDINGDGIDDIIGYGMSGDSNDRKLYVYKYLSSVTNSGAIDFTLNEQTSFTPSFTAMSGNVSNEIITKLNTKSSFGINSKIDFDGDGLNELLLCRDFWMYNNQLDRYIEFYLIGASDNPIIMNVRLSTDCVPLYDVEDLDNDGKTDIIVLETNSNDLGYYKMYILSSSIGPNGNITDIYDYPLQNIIGEEIMLRNNPKQLFLSDMNGNGLKDILILYRDGYSILWNNGGGISCNNQLFVGGMTNSQYITLGTELAFHEQMKTGDYNGDGLLDFLTNNPGSDTWYWHLNDGNGSFLSSAAFTLQYFTDQSYTEKDNDKLSVIAVDFDYDGKTDIITTKAHYSRGHNLFQEWGEYQYTRTCWLQSNGESMTSIRYVDYSDEDFYPKSFLIGDFDGDGHLELISKGYDYWTGSVSTGLKLLDNPSFSCNSSMVTSVTGDFGAVTNIIYSSLTDPAIYTKGTSENYPAPRYTIPLTVVKQTIQNNGVAGSQTVQYNYEGLRVHLQGKGLLGFSKTTASHTTLGVTVRSGVSQWNSTFFVPSVTYLNTTAGNDTLQEITTFTIADKGSGKYLAYPSRIVETDMDNNTVTTTRILDSTYGYVTQETVTYGSDMYSSVSYLDYIWKGGTYHPQTVVSSQHHPDDNSSFCKTAKYTYNDNGQVTQRIDNYGTPLPLTIACTYDLWGNLLSETTEGSGVTQLTTYYDYDATHRFPVRIHTSPESYVCKYTYDIWGNVLTEQDSINSVIDNVITNSYDSWGKLTRTMVPGNGTVTYTRGKGSGGRYFVLVQGTAQPWVKTWYDCLGREILVESVGPNDIEIKKQTTYDSKGQISCVENTIGNLVTSTAYTYDNRGRVLRETASSGASVQYRYGNHSVSATSNGRTTCREYDAMGNVAVVTDPVSTVEYYYSSNGQVRRVEVDDCIYEFSFDNAGNRTYSSDPDAGSTTFIFDALGREIGHTDARDVHYTTNYDAFGRIISETAGDDTITYTYGTSGTGQMRLVGKTLGEWSDTYEYDQYGRVVSLHSGGHTTGYQYDICGLLTRKTWADSGMTDKYIDYTYDTYGNHIASNAISGAIVWNLTQNTGRATTSTVMLNSNATLFTRETYIDNYGYPADYSLKRNSITLGGEVYTYNYGTGNLSQCIKYSYSESYTYDDADRLVYYGLTGTGSQTMTYSSSGNLLSKSHVGGYTYATGSHRVVSVDNTDDVIPYSSQSITYNAWGKVAEVNETVGSDTYKYELTYGPDLQRVQSVLWKNNSLVHLVSYGDGYEEKYQDGETTRYYYVDGADGNSAVYTSHTRTGDKAYCIDRDRLGSITGLYDENGIRRYGAKFDVWGRRYVDPGSIEYDRGYTGHEHIDELGLINMNGRMYDPILGRFISVDPYIQDPYNPQNFNRYAYCLNNPVRYTDPTGNSWSWASALFSCFLCPIPEYISTVITTATTNALIDGTIGLLNGGWNEAYNRASNSLKIDLAPFNNNERWNTKENLGVTASMFLLQADAMALGNIISHFHNVLFKSEVTYTDGAILINHDSKIEKKPGGMTLGSYINGRNVTPDLYSDATFRHEYGHTLQSLMMGGTSYLSFVAWPSLLGCLVPGGHETEWYEEQSNMLSTNYCKNNNITFNSEGYLRLIGVTDNQKETRNKDNEEIWNKSVPKYSVSWRWFFIGIPILPYCLLTF